MKVRKTVAAVATASMIATGAPAVANAQIVAPYPSSQIQIPRDVTNFFVGLTPLNFKDTENALKIGAAYLLISIGLTAFAGVLDLALAAAGLGSSVLAGLSS